MSTRVAVRALCLVLGLAALVYGVASLTGAWLGTPPWWVTYRALDVEMAERDAAYDAANADYARDYRAKWYTPINDGGFIDLEDASVIFQGHGNGGAFRLRPGAPPWRPLTEFALPQRWGRAVRADWEWVGWILAEVGFFVALIAAWPRRRPYIAT